MENSASKPEVLKPIILKIGVPLAVSVAGFIYAYVMVKKNLSKTPSLSSNEANSLEKSSHTQSHVSTEDEEHTREQESLIGEIKNMLSLESGRVDFLGRKVSSMEIESKKLEDFVVIYVKVVEKIEHLKSENKMLWRKVKKLMRKSKAMTHLSKDQALKIKAKEAEFLRNLETKINDIDVLKDEIRELQKALDELQDEKNELLKRLDAAQKLNASKIEFEGVSMEEYKGLLDELEKLKMERAEEAKELIYLKRTNACLRHNLMKHNEQQNQDRNHVEVEFGESNNEVMHYESEDELHNSHLDDHIVPSFYDDHYAYQYKDSVCTKRTKLLKRLKRWVEGSEKKRVRPFVYRGEEKHHVSAWRSCTSSLI